MEQFVNNAMVHAAGLPAENWAGVCGYWEWLFWIGFWVGVAGTVVCLFMKPVEGP